MRKVSWIAVTVVAMLGFVYAASRGAAHAQAPAPADTGAAKSSAELGRPSKSVRGKLVRVDESLNGVIMRSDEGKRMAWKFDRPVIGELAKFKPGDPMIVIYRQMSKNEKRVTAVAFPGSAEKPTYVNVTGYRILMRSSPAVNGICGDPTAQPVTENMVPNGGMTESLEACWCCATDGESCTPGNRTGNGIAILTGCFK
jgi:hypothetical protein